jgi:hypothetical protein
MKKTYANDEMLYNISCNCPYCGNYLNNEEIDGDYHEHADINEYGTLNVQKKDVEIIVECRQCQENFIIKEIYHNN